MLPGLIEAGTPLYDLSKGDPFRDAYHGGIVEVYRPHLKGAGYYYDVNSLYPTAMCRPMPVGKPELINLTEGGISDFFGYVWARVRAPENLYVGLLPIKHQGRLLCPGGTLSGFFFSEELKFALANGYTILEIGQAWRFAKGAKTFKDLILRLNQMKVEAQLSGEPVRRSIAKLMMNSLYGRFGMHPEEGIAAFVTQGELNDLIEAHTIVSEKKIGELYLIEYLPKAPDGVKKTGSKPAKTRNSRPMGTNVPLAAAVTAYSRMIINGYKLVALKQGLNLYYSDTDSLVVDGLMPDHLVDKAELGKLKLEHRISEGYFVAPKIYWFLDADTGQPITACKGYPGDLRKEEIMALYNGNTIHLKVERWLRSLKDQTVSIEKYRDYAIHPLFNKRDKISDPQGRWINTKALIL